MVFPLKTISSDCRYYLPGFFLFLSCCSLFPPTTTTSQLLLFILNPSRFVSYIDARGSGLVGVLGVTSETQRAHFGEIWAYLFVLLS
jgi:hypothetical protein